MTIETRQTQGMYPVGQLGERVAPADLFVDMVFRDFYFSFHHAQGLPEQQFRLFHFLGRQYRDLIGRNEICALEELRSQLSNKAEKLTVPAVHSSTVNNGGRRMVIDKEIEQDSIGGFQHMLGLEVDTVGHYSYGRPLMFDPDRRRERPPAFIQMKEYTNLGLSTDFIEDAVDIEIKYLESDAGRPGRLEGMDPYESLIRRYLVEGKQLQTPRYEEIYSSLREVLEFLEILRVDQQAPSARRELKLVGFTKNEIREKFEKMVSAWEERHPGRNFFEPHSQAITT